MFISRACQHHIQLLKNEVGTDDASLTLCLLVFFREETLKLGHSAATLTWEHTVI